MRTTQQMLNVILDIRRLLEDAYEKCTKLEEDLLKQKKQKA